MSEPVDRVAFPSLSLSAVPPVRRPRIRREERDERERPRRPKPAGPDAAATGAPRDAAAGAADGELRDAPGRVDVSA